MIHVRLAIATVGLVLAGLSGIAEAGVQGVPCRQPFIFKDAAVNVVVLPYESVPGLPSSGDLGTKLSALIQMETLRSIARFGSVGAVQMIGTPDECNPDLVVARLLGRTPGATAALQKGRGLIVVWGRFFSRDGTVFVQTFCRLLRGGSDETLDVTVKEHRFSAQISAQAFACPPRKVTMADLQNFEESFHQAMVLHDRPDLTSSGGSLPRESMPYWITATQGDWMQIKAREGLEGWVRLGGAADAWSLVRWLPELKFVEGMAGYLRTRVEVPQAPAVRPEWSDSATRALREYEAASGRQPAVAADAEYSTLPNALANAVQLQLRGIMMASKPNAESADSAAALSLFERAETLLPHDGHARNLAAIMRLAVGGETPSSDLVKQTAADLLQALSAEPGNTRLLANLQSAYEILLAPTEGSTVLTEPERSEFTDRLATIKQIRAGNSRRQAK